MNTLDSLNFIWPALLWGLALLPILLLLYVWRSARVKRYRDRFPGMLAPAMRGRGLLGRIGRHAPVALLMIALAVLLVAMARPRAMIQVPTLVETVMLAIDTSGSMRADDIKPSRIEAARQAAERFIEKMPPRVRIGIVSFASTASLVQAPTTERDDLLRALQSLPLQRGSAPGAAILVSLAELLPNAGIEVQKIINESMGQGQGRAPAGTSLDARGNAAPGAPTAEVAPGSNRSTAIILLTDGEGNIGPKLPEMTALAAQHGVRVHTVGIGTREGVTLRAEGMSMRVRLDEDSLKKVADATLGEYFAADTATELGRIYQSLSSRIAFERRQSTEVTALFTAAAAALMLLAAALSLQRTGRIA
jgi:Ca-activated chloride channel family protein